jgi:hypothetical protein
LDTSFAIFTFLLQRVKPVYPESGAGYFLQEKWCQELFWGAGRGARGGLDKNADIALSLLLTPLT